jgi:hypothetical protein
MSGGPWNITPSRASGVMNQQAGNTWGVLTLFARDQPSRHQLGEQGYVWDAKGEDSQRKRLP